MARSEKKLCIFLAEDNRADVYLVDIALKEHNVNFTLRAVGDGEEAIRIAENFGRSEPVPHIALLDLNLPRQEGDKVMRTIRQQPSCANIPIIVMTSSESQRDRAIAQQYNAVFFSKPSDLAGFMKLGELVRNLCEAEANTSAA
jgi:CheY-like chemotaxis protein